MTGRRERQDRRMSSAARVSVFGFFVILALFMPFALQARAATSNVTIVDFAFQPSTLNVQIDDTVIWTNTGAATHTVTSDDIGGPLNSGDILSGGTYTYVFTSPGTYAYHCVHHPSMMASVTVGPAIPEYSNFAIVVLGLLILFLGLSSFGKKR